MFEDMLAYEPESLLRQRFSELLAADLDDDAQQLYARMAADIAAVAVHAGGAPPAGVVQTLLEALAAVPMARAALWRRLYRQIAYVTAGCARNGSSDGAPKAALARLRAFLRENADLAEPPAIEAFGPMTFGRAAAN